MPIGSLKTTTAATTAPKSDKSAAASSSSAGPGGGGRTTFRPPWVKADVPEAKPKTTIKTTPPWAKKTTTTAATAAAEPANNAVKKNGETPLAKVASPASSASTKPATATAASKVAPVVAKPLTDAAPVRREAKLQSREIKVPIITEKRKPIQEPLIKPKPKKPPTPSESEEEEEEEEDSDDDDDDETETESESEEEEDSSPPKEAATELERKFQAEKPKMRPIVVKRDKSLSCTQKKRDEEDDDDAEEGETEEDRERRRRFKLERPKLRHVVVNKQKSFNKSVDDFDKIRPVLKKVQKVDEVIKEPPSDAKPEFKDKVLKKVTPVKKDPSKANVPAPPPLPSLVPKPPPPPPPPLGPPSDFEKKALNEKQKATIEKLKTRPRRRPDWSEMMKEVEEGKKLRHVQCNDRSQPIITCKSMTKVDDKFVYETEKDNAHNKLLKQIQGGIRLKSVKTNDRSKPFLDGLRKFRRQMTIEEQIQKSESKATLNEVPQEPDEPSGDELDDIDKLRDDLQSTKQMLALELRNREAQERENKRLLAKIANLEAELQRDKTRSDKDESTSPALSSSSSGADDVLVQSLKKDAEEARKTSKDLEKKYEKSAEELDAAKNEVEEQKRMIQQLEKKLSQALQQSPVSNHIRPQFSFCYSFEDPSEPDTYYNFNSASETEIEQQAEPPQQTNNIKHISNHIANCMNSLKGGGSSMNGSRRPSEANPNKESSPELELELSESEDDEDEEKKAERKQRRLAKEVKILQTKLTKLKDKQEAAKRERANLKQIMKKNHVLLKEENKKFKKLEKEVHKMAASMKEEVDEDDEEKDDDDEEEEEEAEEEQESEEESEEESESEESDDESGSETESESEAEDASDEDKKTNLEPRVKKHENRLSALKKGNVLLQANVDNLQDEISKVREKASSLQAELDSVLADLGL